MRYLDSIDLLSFNLTMLKAGSRGSVKISKALSLSQGLTALQRIMLKDQLVDPMMTAKLGKIRDSVVELSNMTGNITVIPGEVKDSLISELKEIQKYVADKAYEWYSTHEFEDTSQVVTLMREVVMAHFERS